VGLEEDWEALEEALAEAGLSESILLGTPLGSEEEGQFDPGGCGSYFQTRKDVLANASRLARALARSPALAALLAPVSAILEAAVKAQRGLYVTF
jgi:hypothetical protein